MAADHFCLKWNNYQSNMVSELDSLRTDEDLVDVTLSCEGHQLKAHKVILSACSSYFRNVFKENPCKHPVVILKNVSYEDVEALLSFVYQGVVYISEKKLASFLQTAELLQIRGLTGAASTVKETTTGQTKNFSSLPPPQLLSANQINNWKQHQSGTTSVKPSSGSNPSSPAPPKRRKTQPSRLVAKENSDGSDTNSNNESSEVDESSVVRVESVETEMQDNEYIVADENSRELTVREDANNYFESGDADESGEEEDTGDGSVAVEQVQKDFTMAANPDKPFSIFPKATDLTVNFSCGSSASMFSMLSGFSMSPAGSEQTLSSGTDQHRLGKRPCPLCNKIISNKSNLLKHMRIRHSDEYNPARCNLCGKVFKNKYSLRAHINIYHRELPTSASYHNKEHPAIPSHPMALYSNQHSSLDGILDHSAIPNSLMDTFSYSMIREDLPFSISAVSDTSLK